MNIIQKLQTKGDVTLNFVGDSITAGEQYCKAEETYVAKIAALLSRRFPEAAVYRYDGVYATELDPIHEFSPVLVSLGEGEGTIHVVRNGVGGNTVLRAHKRIHNFTGVLASGHSADVTLLMLGINDAIKSRVDKYDPPKSYLTHYRALIEDIRSRDPDTEIVLITSSYNESEHELDDYVGATKVLAEQLSLPLIDLNALWLAHYDAEAENYGQGDWLVGHGDACHFTPKSAEISARFIFDAMMEILTVSTED